jgi:hypothetical protein
MTGNTALKNSPAPIERTFRIGLLVDSTSVSKYTFDLVKWAEDKQNFRITHLIIHAPQDTAYDPKSHTVLANSINSLKTGRPLIASFLKLTRISRALNFLVSLEKSIRKHGMWLGVSKELSRVLFAAVLKTEERLLRRNERHKDHFDSFDLSSLVPELITINPRVSGFVYHFDPMDVRKVRDLNLDLLIRCGSGILRGDILRASKLGIISFHHADNRINRGGPAGFWEVYFRQDTTGFTLQRLTEELDGGDVLMRGQLPTYWFFLLNRAALLEKSNHYLKLLIEKIVRMGKLPPTIRDVPYANELFRAPRMHQAIIYTIMRDWERTKKHFRRRFGIEYRWGVSYTRTDWQKAVLWRGRKLRVPPLCFLADPFVISNADHDICFVEEYDYLTSRGKIAAYDICDGTRIGTALEENFHLSFPFLFKYNSQLFMCPETHQKKEVRIYRCLEFPLRWTLEKTIMRNISAVDTLLFEKQGKWWLFTNIDPIGSGEHCSELSIFFAESPLASNWTPHPLNPIVVDASCARNGGLVWDGESLFRVSQGRAFDFYGKRTRINQIVQLTESHYMEVRVGEITPEFEKGVLGTHHFHSNGKITVFDFVTLSRVYKNPKYSRK